MTDCSEHVAMAEVSANVARKNVPKWKSYFMGFACLASDQNGCRAGNTPRDGCCIVNDKNIIVAVGERTTIHDEYTVHSVADAIVKKNVASLEGCTLYTTIFPCNKCTQLIIQSRIKNVEYLVEADPKHKNDPDVDKYPANCWMMTSAGVKFSKFQVKDEEKIITLKPHVSSVEVADQNSDQSNV